MAAKDTQYEELNTLLAKIDLYHRAINSRRPLVAEEVRQLDQYFKIETTYTSNALEGNSLTLTETKVLLEDGITIGGKPIRDLYEATGHAKAYDFMVTAARSKQFEITEDTIKKLHHLFYNAIDNEQAGCYRDCQVFISGAEYIPPRAEKIPRLMKELIADLKLKSEALHPVLFAAYAHRHLVDIHPFIDGNGRTARLLTNMLLINRGYCVISIPPVLRRDYISALITAQRRENATDIPFNMLIANCELATQKDYCRMFDISLGKIKNEQKTKTISKKLPDNELGL